MSVRKNKEIMALYNINDHDLRYVISYKNMGIIISNNSIFTYTRNVIIY